MGYYLELLQNDMRMKEQIYNSLGKQLENDKALPIEVIM